MPEDVAVILLPGILGSPLKNKHTGKSIWPVHNDISTAWFGWSHTAKKTEAFVDGLDTLNSVTEALRPNTWKEADTQYVASIYHDFVKLAATDRKDTQGKPLAFIPHVYVLNYNWSESTVGNIDDLVSATGAIRAAAKLQHKAEKFMYVTHSMGVLTALATALSEDWVNDDNFKGIVAVAGPINGAPEALMRLMRGFYSPGVTVDHMASITKKLLSNTGWKFSMLAAVFPGFYDLLPWDDLQRNLEKETKEIFDFHFNPKTPVTRGFSINEYNERSWSKACENRDAMIKKIKTSICFSRNLHNYIRNKQGELNDKNKLFAVGLTGKETIQKINIVNLKNVASLRNQRSGSLDIPDTLQNTYSTSPDGDGTVPVSGQIFNAPVNVIVPGGIDHADAFTNKSVWPHIHDGMNWIYNNSL